MRGRKPRATTRASRTMLADCPELADRSRIEYGATGSCHVPGNCQGPVEESPRCGELAAVYSLSAFGVRQSIPDQPAREGWHTVSQIFLCYSPHDERTASDIQAELRRYG